MDWPKLLTDLTNNGWTQAGIADRVGSSQTTISELQRGETKNPAYSLGRALEDLHAKVFGKSKRKALSMDATVAEGQIERARMIRCDS